MGDKTRTVIIGPKGVCELSESTMSVAKPENRPRILLIADVPGWIFDRHCDAFRDYLGRFYAFTVIYYGDPYDESAYDLIYPLEFNLIDVTRIQQRRKYVTGIRSHLSWDTRPIADTVKLLNQYFSRIHVVSRRLHALFHPVLPQVEYITHGIDTRFFSPWQPPDATNGPLRVGWAGNRKSPVKGFEEMITPLARLPGVQLELCGYSDTQFNAVEVREFYERIQVFTCASATEGNSNVLLEAASMGRAIITTDVGTVPEYLNDGVSARIVPRSVEAFCQAVSELRDDPAQRIRLGQAARMAVCPQWDWSQRMPGFQRFFEAALEAVRDTPPFSLESLARDVHALMDQGQISHAHGILAHAVEDMPNHLDVMNLLAEFYAENHQIRESCEVLQSILSRKPDHVPALVNLGVILATNGVFDQAEYLLQLAVTIAPEHEMARENLTQLRRMRQS